MFLYYIRTSPIVLCCKGCYVIKSINLIFVESQYNASIMRLHGAMEEGTPVQAHSGLHSMVKISTIKENSKTFLC